MGYTASGQFVVRRAPVDQYLPPDPNAAGVISPTPAANDQDGVGATDGGSDGGVPKRKMTKATGPRVDRFSRHSLFMIQKPEDTIILDATRSFDLASPVEEEIGFQHVTLVMKCFDQFFTECKDGLRPLKNSNDEALVSEANMESISSENLQLWFGSELKEVEHRLPLIKIQTQMKKRGLSITGLTWIDMIAQLTSTLELPMNPNWEMTWSIDGWEKTQEIPQGISSLASSGEYFQKPRDERYGTEPDLTVQLTDDEIEEHLGDLWLTNLGRAQYSDMLKENGEACSKDDTECVPTKLMPRQYGIKLARKLLRKVTFSKGVAMGLWNIQLSIRDGDNTDGDQKIPFTVANCEPPDLQIEWNGQFDDKPGRTNLPLVNPSDKVKIRGGVWYFGMGDVSETATSSTIKMWNENKGELTLTWESVNDGTTTFRYLKKGGKKDWNATLLEQQASVLETVDGLEMTNLVIAKWMLQPNDPGILEYSKYKFKLGVQDICSQGRDPVYQEFKVVVNSPPYDGYMALGKLGVDRVSVDYSDRFGTALNDTFQAWMYDWKDTDLPLSYAYKYMLDDGTGYQTQFGKPCDIEDKFEDTMCNEVPVSSLGFVNGSNSTLDFPAGQIVVVGYIQDEYGAKTRWLYLNKTIHLQYLANVTMWEPAFNGTDAKAAALMGAADNLAASSEGASDDEAISGINAVVGMLNDANASIVACCNGHAFVDNDEESETYGEVTGCTLTKNKAGIDCDFGHDPMCAVIECKCSRDYSTDLIEGVPEWEGDFCERPSGKKLVEKQKTKEAIVTALKSVNFSDPNASSVAEGGGKALAQVTLGGDLKGDMQQATTKMVEDMVNTASGADSMSLEQGGPMLSCVSNLVAAPVNQSAPDAGPPGSNPNGNALMGKMEGMGDSMLGANVPGEQPIGMAGKAIQSGTQVQTILGMKGLFFEPPQANNCTLGPKFEFPEDMSDAELSRRRRLQERRSLEGEDDTDLSKASTSLNVKGQQSKDNIHGDGASSELNHSLAPGPSSYDWDPYGDGQNNGAPTEEGGVTFLRAPHTPSPSGDGYATIGSTGMKLVPVDFFFIFIFFYFGSDPPPAIRDPCRSFFFFLLLFSSSFFFLFFLQMSFLHHHLPRPPRPPPWIITTLAVDHVVKNPNQAKHHQSQEWR